MHLEETLIRTSGPISMIVGMALTIFLFHLEASGPQRQRWLNFLAIYIFIVVFFIAAARSVQTYLRWRVDSFDLNGNGIFEPTEPFGSYAYLQHHVVADTGRAMVFITAPVLAPFFMLIGYAVFRAIRFVCGLIDKLRT